MRYSKKLLCLFMLMLISIPAYSALTLIKKDFEGALKTDATSVRFCTIKDGELRISPLTEVKDYVKDERVFLVSGALGVKCNAVPFVVETEDVVVKVDMGCTLVVKRVFGLTRVCVVAGSAIIEHKHTNKNVRLLVAKELAASKLFLSDIYLNNDDLRFLWYWVDITAEPSLQP